MGAILNQAQNFCGRLALWSKKVKLRNFMRMQYRCGDMTA